MSALAVRDFVCRIAGAGWAPIMIAVWFLVASARPVQGDQWVSPAPQTVVSPNGTWSASMTPASVDGTRASISVARTARSNHNDGWARALVNSSAPVDLFVSDIGAVVTLGDWHSEGYEHSIVIYDSRGSVVVDRQLEDFLKEDELERAERSVSSRWWRYRSESPEFVGEEFSLTTSWGTLLRFDVRTGRVSRDPGLFGRFRSYCDGTRRARETVIYISRVWKEGDRYTGRHCEVRRTGAACHSGGERYRSAGADAKIAFASQKFDRIVRDATAMTANIVDDGVYEFDASFIHLQMVFGENIVMDGGRPTGGDVYWFRYKPAEVPVFAREWTKRLETLVRTP